MHIGKNNDDSCLTKPDSQAMQYPTATATSTWATAAASAAAIALAARHFTN